MNFSIRIGSLFYFIFLWGITTGANSQSMPFVEITGASKAYELDQATGRILGGTAGEACSDNLLETCNSCKRARQISKEAAEPNEGLIVCNHNRILPSTRLEIVFTTPRSGTIMMTYGENHTTTLNMVSGFPTQAVAGEIVRFVTTWSQVCSAIPDLNDSCNRTSSTLAPNRNFRVGVSSGGSLSGSNATYRTLNITVSDGIQSEDGVSLSAPCTDSQAQGFCAFDVLPGNRRAFLEGIRSVNPSHQPLPFRYLRVLYSTEGFNAIHADSSFNDILLTQTRQGEFSFPDPTIQNLSNETEYFFKVAAVDEAGNTGYYTPKEADTYCENSEGTMCHRATPGEVVGLLTENSDCFIATYAFGPQSVLTETLREFRDRILLTFHFGEKLTHWYYYWSKPKVQALSKKPFWLQGVLGTLFGLALLPLVGLAYLILNPIFICLTLIGAACFYWRKYVGATVILLTFYLPTEGTILGDLLPEPIEREQGGAHQYPTDLTKKGPYYILYTDEVSDDFGVERPTRIHSDGSFHYKTEKKGDAQREESVQVPLSVRDNIHYYGMEELEKKGSFAIRGGSLSPPETKNRENNLSFTDIYTESRLLTFFIDQTKTLTSGFLGDLRIKGTIGLFSTKGDGRFRKSERANQSTNERFRFVGIPIELSAHYILNYFQRQFVHPFISSGIGYTGFMETIDGNLSELKYGGATLVFFGGGILFPISWLDRGSAQRLFSEFKIRRVDLIIDIRQNVGLKDRFDMTSMALTGGFSFEF